MLAQNDSLAVSAAVVGRTTATSVRALGVTWTIRVDTTATTHWTSSRWAWASGESRVAAKHGYSRTILGSTQGNHMLANVGGNDLAAWRISVGEDVLNEVVSELITSD